ncbi:MAG: hypothetical protein J7M13_01340 [Synergistetes bacterium]|nr:hypothetical protein [Synergistota bacterium]
MKTKIAIGILFLTLSFFISEKTIIKCKTIKRLTAPPKGVEKLYEIAFTFERKAASQYLFIKAILHYMENSNVPYKTLAEMLVSAFRLDPRSEEIPSFTANNLTLSKEGSRTASRALRKMALYREDWRIWAQIGFIKLFYLDEPIQAERCIRVALKYPGACEYLRGLLILAFYRGKKYEAGMKYILNELKKCRDERKRFLLKKKLLWLTRLNNLEKAVNRFLRSEGRFPSSLQELVQKGYIGKIPRDPWGKGFYWDAQERRVKSRL